MNSSRKTCLTTLTVGKSGTAAISNRHSLPVWGGRLAAPCQPVLLALLLVLLSALPGATAAQAAIITVNVLTDNVGDSCPATCSLRAALATVSAGNEIQFSVTGTITLSQGELVVGTDVTITGPGASSLALDGNQASRVLRVNSGVTATISGLTIQNGTVADDGGGVYNEGTVTVTNSTLSGNSAGGDLSTAGYGGGIYNAGDLTVTNSTLSGNSSGGVGANGYGGGIANNGDLTVTNSTLSGNIARNGSGGGIYNEDTATVTNSTLSGNIAGGSQNLRGGGIFNSGDLTVTDSTLSGNSAGGFSGAIGSGGGIFNEGTATVTDSTLSGNSTNDFGASGGGIYNAGDLTVTNSTLSGNSTSDFGASGGGGGIYNAGTVTVTDSTLSGNSAIGSGGGIFNIGTLNLASSIVANSSGGNCGGDPITSQGDNLSSDATCVSTNATLNDRNNTDPFLDPAGLQDNGGPTPTIALQPTSPALDGVLHNACPPPATDQRGVPRPQGARCDIGAFELEQEELPIEVRIDIKPGSARNPLNPRNHGVIPVAILTTDSFEATTADPRTVLFGATGTEAAPVQSALEDVDGDGDIDMILHFRTQDTDITCGDTSASLTGETLDGQLIEGADAITTIGCE